MFKIIQLDVSEKSLCVCNSNNNNHQYLKWIDLKNEEILKKENFERTLVGVSPLTNILDLEKRSSWSHKLKFLLELPNDIINYFEKNDIVFENNNTDYFSLLKYETNDFFLNHRDTDLTDVLDNVIHKYTCLIFCPYRDDENLEGGEIIFKHPENLYEIKFDSSVETNNNKFVMIIFSIDMYHEVLPIIKGTRYVFKKPLFVKTNSNQTINTVDEDDELCDGGGFSYLQNTSDY